MRDLSIDLETLALGNNAHIVAIGAVLFDAETGDIGASFYRTIVQGSDPRADIDPEVVQWWGEQEPRVRSVLIDPLADPAEDVLLDFSIWVGESTFSDGFMVRPWGNGSIFDITIIESALKRHNTDIPWRFWNIRDVRTVTDLMNVRKNDVPFLGTPHHALDDAMHQARLVIEAYKRRR